jgi:hypothetical protein
VIYCLVAVIGCDIFSGGSDSVLLYATLYDIDNTVHYIDTTVCYIM